jgi:hypothetical protein
MRGKMVSAQPVVCGGKGGRAEVVYRVLVVLLAPLFCMLCDTPALGC